MAIQQGLGSRLRGAVVPAKAATAAPGAGTRKTPTVAGESKQSGADKETGESAPAAAPSPPPKEPEKPKSLF